MGPYDDRRATLDPGLTALALRARRNPRGRYPFLESALRGRNLWLLVAGSLTAALAAWRRRRRAVPAPAAPRPTPAPSPTSRRPGA